MPSHNIEITSNQRGFHQYGEPVQTSYGDSVSVYESSAASGPHCWLRINPAEYQRGNDDMCAHLNVEQATAIRDRLNAWLDEIPARWNRGFDR